VRSTTTGASGVEALGSRRYQSAPTLVGATGFGFGTTVTTGTDSTTTVVGIHAGRTTLAAATSMIGGVGLVGDPRQQGYSILSADGHADPEGQRAYFGSIYQPGVPLAAPIVGIAATPGGSGYWLANSPAMLATDRGQMVEDRYSAISLTTVDDGPLGALYGFDSLCTESGDGHCGAVLLFLDHGLVASTARGAGVATAPGPAVLATLRSITGVGVGTLRACYRAIGLALRSVVPRDRRMSISTTGVPAVFRSREAHRSRPTLSPASQAGGGADDRQGDAMHERNLSQIHPRGDRTLATWALATWALATRALRTGVPLRGPVGQNTGLRTTPSVG
jgi:hypothetical protein